nr:hypothetical protein [Tanacetum cinerariifolium]
PPPSPICSLGYRATMIRLRDKAASTSPSSLQLLSASRTEDRPEVTLPPQKRQDMDEIYTRLDDEQTKRQLLAALQGQVTALQRQVTALQAQVTTLQGQQGLAGDHIQSELPEEAGGSA